MRSVTLSSYVLPSFSKSPADVNYWQELLAYRVNVFFNDLASENWTLSQMEQSEPDVEAYLGDVSTWVDSVSTWLQSSLDVTEGARDLTLPSDLPAIPSPGDLVKYGLGGWKAVVLHTVANVGLEILKRWLINADNGPLKAVLDKLQGLIDKDGGSDEELLSILQELSQRLEEVTVCAENSRFVLKSTAGEFELSPYAVVQDRG